MPLLLVLFSGTAAVENHRGGVAFAGDGYSRGTPVYDSPLGFPDRTKPPAEQPAPTIRFRRILAPSNRMKDWPTDGEKYLPMDAEAFEQMVKSLRAGNLDNHPPPAATITSARYEARLVGDRLVGEAVWDVVLVRDGPAMMPVEPCGPAICDARWQATDDTLASKSSGKMKEVTPAVMGLRSDGRIALLVKRSGRVKFNWSLVARRDSGGVSSFAFEMPPAAVNRLSIVLPDDCTPRVDHGILLGGKPLGEMIRRWTVELPRNGRLNLHVVSAGASAGRPLALLRESRTYDCSPRGLDAAAQWRLQVHNEPLEKITLLLDPGLRLVSAQLGDVAIPWSIVSSDESGENRIELNLPEPIRDVERVIRLGAIGPALLGRTWRLPRIRAESLFWQEGNLTVLTPEPLSADRLEPIECVQTAAGPLSPPRVGRTAQFQCFDPDATVEVLLVRRPTKTRLISVAEIEVGEESAAARLAAEFHITGGAKSTVSADISPQWIIDAVDSMPEGNVADWTVDQSSGGGRKLTVRLNEPLGPLHPARLEIRCRRRFSPKTNELRQADLSPLVFQSIDDAVRLAAVRPAVGRDLEIVGGERLPCLSKDDLTETESALFSVMPGEATPSDIILDCDGRTESLEIGLRPKDAKPPPSEQPNAPIRADSPDRRAATAWVWRSRIESWYQNGESSRHLAAYEVRNNGRRRLELSLPREIGGEDVRGVWLDGEPAAWQSIDDGRISIKLPAERSNLRIAVEWTADEPRLGVTGRLRAVAPEPDSPVLSRQWIVRLPPGYEIADPRGGEPTAAAPKGWTAWRIDSAPSELRYIRRDSFRLFGVIALLMVVAAGCRRGRTLTSSLIMLVAFSVAAVFLPDAFAAPAWGGMIGAAFCLAWRLPIASGSAEAAPPRRPRSSSDSTVTMISPLEPLCLLVCLSIVFAICRQGEASFSENVAGAAKTAATEKIHNVIVPINAEQKPVGKKVFLSERFYRELHRLAAGCERPSAWMIVGASYSGELVRDASAGRLSAGNIHARYELHVFQPGVRVRLPLGSEGASFLAGSARLDGRAIETIRDKDNVPVIELAEPGQCLLELSLRPTARAPGATGGFDLSIPRVPDSRIELALPEGSPAVEVASARGSCRLEEASRRLTAKLGAADRLSVQWVEDAAGSGQALDVKQLAWLKVQPGSVSVAVRFIFHSFEGRIQQMRLAVDPRWKLLPISGENPPTVQLGPESGAARTVTLRWPRPLVGQTVLETTFLLGGASGVGNVPLPKIEPLDFTPAGNWMAVAVDPALDYDRQEETPLETVAAADFLQVWGKSDSTPQFAFRMPDDSQAGCALATRPHQPKSSADQTLSLGIGENRADVVFEAAVSVASGYVFQHRLTAPRGFKVESVSVLENDIECVQRWSADDDGLITVFLGSPASASQKLTVRGSLPVEMNRPWPLPVFRVEQCDLRSATIRLHRRPDVLLDVRGEEGEQLILDDVTTAVGTIHTAAARRDLGRPVRNMRWDGGGRLPAEVTVRPNRPKISAEQTIRLMDEGGSWSAQTTISLRVAEGIVDEIVFRVPTPWNGPYRADQPGELAARDIPGHGRCLVFRPAEPISSDYSLTVIGPLELSDGELPCLPDIRSVGYEASKRFVELPRRAGNRIYRWRTQGLQAVGVKAVGGDSSRRKNTGQASSGTPFQRTANAIHRYTVSGKTFRACLESVEGGSASVELADVALIWSDDGRLCGAARLDVVPGGNAELPLRLPGGCELIEVLVEGRPAAMSRADDGSRRIELASPNAPQLLEIVFSGDTPPSGGLRFDAPTIDDAPVHHVRWTIGVPPGRIVSDPRNAAAVEPWTPNDFLLRALGGEKVKTFQYESPPGERALTLECSTSGPSRLPRYLAAAVALTALGLLVLKRKYRPEEKL